MQTRRILTGALAAPLLLLPACGGGGTSVADPPVAPRSSPSSTAAPQRETPEHFIRRWVLLSNEMEQGSDTRAYMALSRDCRPCSALAKQIISARTNGGFYRSAGWTVTTLKVRSVGKRANAVVRVDSAPTAYKESRDAPIHHYSGGHFSFHITAIRIGREWKVADVAQIAS